MLREIPYGRGRARVYGFDLLPAREMGELEGHAIRCFLGGAGAIECRCRVGMERGHFEFDTLWLIVSAVDRRSGWEVVGHDDEQWARQEIWRGGTE